MASTKDNPHQLKVVCCVADSDSKQFFEKINIAIRAQCGITSSEEKNVFRDIGRGTVFKEQ
jgi:hypothetical protein